MRIISILRIAFMAVLSNAYLIPHDLNGESFAQLFSGDWSPSIIKEFLKSMGFNPKDEPVPLFENNHDHIPDSYIVVLKDHVDSSIAELHRIWVTNLQMQMFTHFSKRDMQHPFLSYENSGIEHVYDISENFKGYSGKFNSFLIKILSFHPDVEIIEKNSMVYATDFNVQYGAPWGLYRISHREKPSLDAFNSYVYDTDGGKDVNVYVVDTGINIGHQDFEGRAVWGKTIPFGDVDDDDNGHGTHCAGTIAGATFGVAKKANLIAVKVLSSNGSGRMSDVIGGLQYAAISHRLTRNDPKIKGSVINMSLGGGKSFALKKAVNNCVNLGIHVSVAAGNENGDACSSSPADSELAITVGASDITDKRASFSNYGKCVDIFAPGVNIHSTFIGSPTSTNVLSGTSMASPHVAGLLAYFLSFQKPQDPKNPQLISPYELKKKLLTFAWQGLISNLPEDTMNLLAYNLGYNLYKDFWDFTDSFSNEKPVYQQPTHLHESDLTRFTFGNTLLNGALQIISGFHKIIFGF